MLERVLQPVAGLVLLGSRITSYEKVTIAVWSCERSLDASRYLWNLLILHFQSLHQQKQSPINLSISYIGISEFCCHHPSRPQGPITPRRRAALKQLEALSPLRTAQVSTDRFQMQRSQIKRAEKHIESHTHTHVILIYIYIHMICYIYMYIQYTHTKSQVQNTLDCVQTVVV